ncbi:MAG: hypothetical protein AB8B72_09695 [Crocinitomicaceae bacterium]
MNNIIQIYRAIKLKTIIYEAGDLEATIHCELQFDQKSISTKLVVSHTDLNRLISKMDHQNENWIESNKQVLYLEDGSQLIEYQFTNQLDTTIHNFHFSHSYAQIGA